ncbi:chitin synthase chs-2-like [Mya arenaria]|uniref:chitin synthase chs-2-like n=1 Tax=Mya arenaria TaxID=6604 RepID=UPI0022E1F4B2|nr:chitin synthase chs-2-like [Mya arenaria]
MPEMPTQQRMGEASSGQSRQTGLRQPPSGQSTPQSTLRKSGDNPPPVKICAKGEKDDMQRKTDIWNLPKETKKKENKSSKCGDTFLKMCRVVLFFVLTLLLLSCGILHKLYFLTFLNNLSEKLHVSSPSVMSKVENKKSRAISILVCIAFFEFFTSLVTLWRVVLQDQKTNWTRHHIVTAILQAVTTIGEVYLIIYALPLLDSLRTCLVLTILPIIPSICKFLSSIGRLKVKGCIRKGSLLKLCIAGFPVLALAGSVFLFMKWLILFDRDMHLKWALPILLMCKSLCYMDNFLCLRRSANAQKQTSGELDSHSETSESKIEEKQYKTEHKQEFIRLTVRWLICLMFIISIVLKLDLKLIEKPDNKNESESSLTDENGHIESFAYNSTTNFTPAQHENGNETLDSTNAFNQTMFNQLMEFYDIYKFETRILTCSFAISQLALLACRLSMQQFSFALPLILTPLLSIIAVVSLSCNNFLESTQITVGIDLTCSMPEDNERNIFIASGALAWIAVIALTWYIWVPRVERMAKLERLFSGSFYDFFFPDLNMLLRRRNDHQIREQHMDSVQPRDVPKVIICVTMWHETCQEMCQLLKSICRLDLHLSIREEADHVEEDKNGADSEKQDVEKKTQDPDKINIEVQIVFDDAFCSTKNGREVNEYLLQFMSCLQKAVGSVLKDKELLEWNKTFQKKVVQTPYGGQFILQLPGGTQMTIHLKDKKKIRPRKRWSQVMYMYYCLLYKMGKTYPDTIRDELKKTFILTLDGDVDFEPKSVLRMMDRMKMNSRVAAVCGRIHPIGSGPMVWYQQFEYAVGHWLQKACEHIFGSVLCCPGCFSIFRASALVDDNVLKTYTKEPEEGKHLVQFEQGEDRWLCTLLIKRGYKIDYCAASDAKTFAPENFWDFFVQRRRWSPSTMANMIDLVLSWKQIVQNNREINHMFMIYQLVLVLTSVLAPGIVLVMIEGSFSSVFSLKPWHSFFVAVTPVVLFAVLCLTVTQKKQLLVAAILSTAYTFVMVIVTIGMILNIVSETILSPSVIFLIFVGVAFLISALLHPQEFTCLFPGLLYYVSVPSTFIFLTVFYMCNLHDIRWGTRESKSPSSQSEGGSGNKKSFTRLLIALVQQYLQAKLGKINPNGSDLEQVERQQSEQHVDFINYEDDSYWIKAQLTDSKHKFKKYLLSEDEETFWTHTINKYLKPLEANKKLQEKFNRELISLRNNCVYGFFVLNFMLSLALLQLQVSKESLNGFYITGKYEPLSVLFLSIFAILLCIQFIFMLSHRWRTFCHFISSTEVFVCFCSRRTKTKAQEFQEHLKEIEHDLEEDEEEDEPPPDYMSEPDVDYDDFDCETVLDTASPSPNRPNSRKFNIYHHRIQTVRYRKQHRQPIDASLCHLDGGYVDGSFLRPGVKYPSNIFHEDRRG